MKLAENFKRFLKKVHTLRVNETKVTPRNAFIDSLFALKRDKESKNDKRTLFQDYWQILDVGVYAHTANATYMWFSGMF